MKTKTRLVTMAILLILSVLGGFLTNAIGVSYGLSIGTLGTYSILTLLLIITGKVQFKRKSTTTNLSD